jgi:uncharacterized protein YbcV (DUF1398 family)
MSKYTLSEKKQKIIKNLEKYQEKKITSRNFRIASQEAKVLKFRKHLEDKFRKYEIRSRRKVGDI